MSLRASSSVVKGLVQRGFHSTRSLRAEVKGGGKGEMTHAEVTRGDGHHGVRPGYSYDWEHGPHYIDPSKIPNFQKKWSILMPCMFVTALSIPIFTVWYQQSKLKA